MKIFTPYLVPSAKILDLGCGIGHDVLGYADMGFESWGVEISGGQLANSLTHPNVHYVQAPAESLPFENESFDAVFSDHGAFDFSPPDSLLREASRILRPNGILAICVYSPLLQACFDKASGQVSEQLTNKYGTAKVQASEDVVVFNYTYSDWIRFFKESGFEVMRLEEILAPKNTATYFRDHLSREWAEKWPAEQLWVVRKSSV